MANAKALHAWTEQLVELILATPEVKKVAKKSQWFRDLQDLSNWFSLEMPGDIRFVKIWHITEICDAIVEQSDKGNKSFLRDKIWRPLLFIRESIELQ